MADIETPLNRVQSDVRCLCVDSISQAINEGRR